MVFEEVALSFVPNLGSRGAMHLIECFGSARAIYEASEQQLIEQAELRADIARAIAHRGGFAEAEREIAYCERHGIAIVAATDEGYSEKLRFIADRPHILYIKGNVEALSAERVVSVVGTRRMTPYGELMCNRIIEAVAKYYPDTVIVSGLAYGIDAAAHRAALAAGLRTVGVVANALPSVTPAANRALAEDMVRNGGAIVSEVSSQTRQNGNLYIPRNRIVAGMCDGLLVVETPLSGGSIHTAHAADGYSREVMALPGRASDIASQGTNAMIRNGLARLVTSGEELLEVLGWPTDQMPERIKVEERTLNSAEEQILALLGTASDGVALDTIIERSGLGAGVVSATLLDLELSGLVRSLPGKIYEKLN